MTRILFIALIFASTRTFGAMSDTACATEIVTNLKTLNAEITGEEAETALLAQWKEICKGLIAHITASALVTVTGITAGPSATTGTIQ